MKIYLLSFLFFTFLIVTPALAGHVIIVNTSNTISEISKKDLKNIYRLKKTNWDGSVSIQPINLKTGSEIRKDFSEAILGKSPKAVESFYLKRALSGKGQPPKILKTEEEVIKYVSSNKGAIGYVSKADGSVKVISIK